MSAIRKDYDEAVALFRQGYTTAEVAEIHGITRQAMRSALVRRGIVMKGELSKSPEAVRRRELRSGVILTDHDKELIRELIEEREKLQKQVKAVSNSQLAIKFGVSVDVISRLSRS